MSIPHPPREPNDLDDDVPVLALASVQAVPEVVPVAMEAMATPGKAADIYAQALRQVVVDHGPDVCADPGRMQALLRVQLSQQPGHHDQPIQALVQALEYGAAHELQSAVGQSKDMVVLQLAQRLHADLGLTAAAAAWVVAAWTTALEACGPLPLRPPRPAAAAPPRPAPAPIPVRQPQAVPAPAPRPEPLQPVPMPAQARPHTPAPVHPPQARPQPPLQPAHRAPATPQPAGNTQRAAITETLSGIAASLKPAGQKLAALAVSVTKKAPGWAAAVERKLPENKPVWVLVASALGGALLMGLLLWLFAGRSGGAPSSQAVPAPASDHWKVIFRSSDPSIWNDDVRQGDNHFAMALELAPNDIQHLRLTNMTTRDYVILPMTKDRIGRRSDDGRYGWDGLNDPSWGGRHLGVFFHIWPADNRGDVCVSSQPFYRGWGFGHHQHINDVQCYAWDGQPIAKTVFEIAVTSQPLTDAETKKVLKPGNPRD